jgi:hypothetical protein
MRRAEAGRRKVEIFAKFILAHELEVNSLNNTSFFTYQAVTTSIGIMEMASILRRSWEKMKSNNETESSQTR